MKHLKKFNESNEVVDIPTDSMSYLEHRDDIDYVKKAIEGGFDPNFDNGFPLRMAIKDGNLDMVKLLVTSGADVSIRRNMCFSFAAQWGKVEILQYLLTVVDLPEETITQIIFYTETSDKTQKAEKENVIKVLQDKLNATS